MFRQWLKQFLALCLCVLIILSSFTTAFADDYVKDDEDEGDNVTYYIVDGEDVSELFDFSLGDVPDILAWIKNFKTYTVIKKIGSGDDAEYRYYFNTPNLQTLVKNKVTGTISDGYQDQTYDVNDMEWLVDVGFANNSTTPLPQTAITKYGFAIDSPIYMGEYPKEVMSVAGVVPTSFWDSVWRFIKSIVGISFLKAPDADNFNTITYMNHGYEDKNQYVVEFFQKYYLPYFEAQIATGDCANGDTDYFTGPEDVIALTVTEDQNREADAYNLMYQEDYEIAYNKIAVYNIFNDNKNASEKPQANGMWYSTFNQNGAYDIDNKVESADVILWDYELNELYDGKNVTQHLISQTKYKDAFITWANNNKKQVFILTSIYYLENPLLDSPLAGITSYSDSCFTVNEDNYSLFANACHYAKNCFGNLCCSVEIQSDEDENEDGEVDSNDKKIEEINVYGALANGYISTDSYGNVKKVYIYGVSNTDWTSPSGLLSFYKDASVGSSLVEWKYNDFVTTEENAIYNNYVANEDTMERYAEFKTKMEKGGDDDSNLSREDLLYKQCMIPNEGEDGECWSKKYGDGKTTITMANVYAYSGIYKITRGNSKYYTSATSIDTLKWDYDENGNKVYVELQEADVYKILNQLQSYCGPYYSIVLSNMIKLMCMTAIAEGDFSPLMTMQSDDPRIMPYDTDAMTTADAENYSVKDPRVEIYKSHIIGGLISDFELIFGFEVFMKPQKTIISIAGKVTELSIFMQQLMSFDKFDDWGLSPTTLWDNGYVALLTGMLALFFIIKTISAIIKMGTEKANLTRIVIAFIILVLELGFITAMAVNPEKVWGTVKKTDTFLITLGERLSPQFNDPNKEYLFGDTKDITVMYYLPYLDTWSKFNTGYGLDEPEQLMWQPGDDGECPPELVDYYDEENKNPIKIGSNNVRHYSVLLADSFAFYGESKSMVNSVIEKDETGTPHNYNGNSINNNAYRVVDHFLAPRVNLTDNGDGTLSLSVTENENYNGYFQGGFVDLIVKLLNCCLICFLSFIKFMTFLWQWFMFYIFIFKVILGKGPEKKTWGQILTETFSPTLCLIVIGMYSGLIMDVGMKMDGLVGIVVLICLFIVTFFAIRWWHNLNRGLMYPKTLGWLYLLLNMKQHNRNVESEKLHNKFQQDFEDSGITLNEGESIANFEDETKVLFDKNGAMDIRFTTSNPSHSSMYESWYRQAKFREYEGRLNAPEELAALRTMETDERFKKIREDYQNAHKPKNMKRYDKFRNDENDKQNNNSNNEKFNNSKIGSEQQSSEQKSSDKGEDA
jgi:hypothetical protein